MKVVAASLIYFTFGWIGLAFANLSREGGYSIKYQSFLSSLIYSAHNTMDAPNRDDIIDYRDLNYDPHTVFGTFFDATCYIMYYWLMVVLLTGAFLPVYSKIYQYKCLRGNLKLQKKNTKGGKKAKQNLVTNK